MGIDEDILTDALDRSLLLAAAMDSRGYGRTAGAAHASRRWTAALVVGGLLSPALAGLITLSGPVRPRWRP